MWLMKRLFPILLAWFIKRKIQKGGFHGGAFGSNGCGGFWSTGFGGPQQQEPQQKKKEEGKVIISDMPKQEKVIDKEIGEYVDFEE